MYSIRPIGSAACVRALAAIRVAGERFTRGGLVPFLKRVAEPIGFCMRASNCLGGLLAGPLSFRCVRILTRIYAERV